MPEGPSIVILKEEALQFKGKKVISIAGNSSADIIRMEGKIVTDFKSWGKHFLICFTDFTVKIHLLMFGSYKINERKEINPRLSLVFSTGELNFYTCSIKILEGKSNLHYDWSIDVMNENWDAKKAKQKLESQPETMICDALLDQNIFSGVGNIIKNEVLYRCNIHPESLVGKISLKDIERLIDESVNYSFEFLIWKKKYELKKHWLVYSQSTCKQCKQHIKRKHTGIKNRRSFICTNCQQLYQ